MAGDWMKVELELPDKPEVHYIAGALGISPAEVVGHLIRIWAWFNKHTEDGHAYGVTQALLDRITGVTGIGEAMTLVGWLEQHDKTLCMPKFDRHTSESSKKRALAADRQSRKRNADSVTIALPREEKRRVSNKAQKVSVPEGWEPKATTLTRLAAEQHLSADDLRRYIPAFHDSCRANNYRYSDFDAAFSNCVRQDWPRLRQGGTLTSRKVASG